MNEGKGLVTKEAILELPILPLRDVVVYPHMVVPLFVGRDKSIYALEAAMVSDKKILLISQKNSADDDPVEKHLFQVGTIASVLQLLKLPDGTVKVLVEGECRGKVIDFITKDKYLAASVEKAITKVGNIRELEILSRSLLSQFDQYIKLHKKIPPEILASLSNIDDPARLIDTISANLALKVEEKQELLELENLQDRLERLMVLLETEIDLIQVEKRIRGRIKRQMEKSQREYYLNEQIKAIQKELGEMSDEPNEIESLEQKIQKVGMPKEAKEKSLSELNKLKLMPPMSAEATVLRNYLDWMLSVPWKKRNKIRYDLEDSLNRLDNDHYGLNKVKERIIEYLAVQQRVKKLRGPILCLVGPPGVGKTSLGQSIANATGRSFIRIALGGVRDEAESAIKKELSLLRSEKVNDTILDKIKNKVESTQRFSEINVLNKAMNLAIAELTGDANDANTEIEKYQRVTSEDIHRLANEILIDKNCSTLVYARKEN